MFVFLGLYAFLIKTSCLCFMCSTNTILLTTVHTAQTSLPIHNQFDLKGSLHKRTVGEAKLEQNESTLKDLDWSVYLYCSRCCVVSCL